MRRILPFFLVVAMLGHAVAALFYAFWVSDESVARVVYFGSKIVVNALPLIWVIGVERQRLRFPKPVKAAWMPGVATGLLIGGILLALYYMLFAEGLDPSRWVAKADRYGARDHFFLFAFFLCLGNSGLEEYYWRWFVFGSLKRVMNVPAAVVVSSLGFTLHHIVVLSAYFPDPSLVVLLNAGVFAGGCIWAILYHRYGTIYAPWVSHLLVDVAIMTAGYDLLFRN